MTYQLYQPKLDPRLYNPQTNQPWQGETWKTQGLLDPNDPYNDRNMERYTNELTRHMQYRPSHNIDEFGVTQTPQYQMINGQAVEHIGGDYVGNGSPGRRGYFLDRGTLNQGQMYDPYGNITNAAGRYRKLPINQGLTNQQQRGHQPGDYLAPSSSTQRARPVPTRAIGTYLPAQQQSNSALNPAVNKLTGRLGI